MIASRVVAVIALAEEGNELTAVRALQLGALDYLPKKLLTPERLSTAVRIALHRVERRVARRLAILANLSRDADLQTANAAEQTAVPPAARMPSLTFAASTRLLKLQGIVSIHEWATPTIGFARSSLE